MLPPRWVPVVQAGVYDKHLKLSSLLFEAAPYPGPRKSLAKSKAGARAQQRYQPKKSTVEGFDKKSGS